jgi:hypothetical protein
VLSRLETILSCKAKKDKEDQEKPCRANILAEEEEQKEEKEEVRGEGRGRIHIT